MTKKRQRSRRRPTQTIEPRRCAIFGCENDPVVRIELTRATTGESIQQDRCDDHHDQRHVILGAVT